MIHQTHIVGGIQSRAFEWVVPRWKELSAFGEALTMDRFGAKSNINPSGRGHKRGIIGVDLWTWFSMNRALWAMMGSGSVASTKDAARPRLHSACPQ